MKVPRKWLTPELMAVLFSSIFASFAEGMLHPILPLYLQDQGVDPGTIGLIFVAMIFATAIGEFLWGRMIDRSDPRIAMVVGTIGLGIVTLAFQYAPSTQGFFVAAFLFGFFRSPLWVTGRWYMGVNAPTAMKTMAMASLGTVYSIAQSAAGFTTGFVTNAYGYSTVIWIAAWLPFLVGLVLLFTRPWLDFRRPRAFEGLGQGQAYPMVGSATSSLWMVFWLGLVASAYYITVGNMLTYLPLFATDVAGANVRQVGVLFGVQSLVFALAMAPLGRLADKLGKRKFLIAGLVLVMLSAGGVALARSYSMLLLCVVVYALGSSMFEPAGVATLSDRMPPERQGTALGIYALLEDVGWAIGPALGGVLWGMSGPRAPFMMSSLAAAIGVGLSLWVIRTFLARS
jgi:MFS family permease